MIPLSLGMMNQLSSFHPVRRARSSGLGVGNVTAFQCGSISGLYRDACPIQPCITFINGDPLKIPLSRPTNVYTDMAAAHARERAMHACPPPSHIFARRLLRTSILIISKVKACDSRWQPIFHYQVEWLLLELPNYN